MLHQMLRAAVGAVWTPVYLYANGISGGWYNASKQKVWQDDSGATGVTASSDPVGRMIATGGPDGAFIQTSASRRPAWTSYPDGKGSLTFTGSELMVSETASSVDIDHTTGATIAIVAKRGSTTNIGYLLWRGPAESQTAQDPADLAILMMSDSDGRGVRVGVGATGFDPAGYFHDANVTLPVSEFLMILVDVAADGQTFDLYVNGVQVLFDVAAGPKGTSTLTSLGARHNLSAFFDGEIADTVTLDRHMTASEREDLTDYLMAKWSIQPLQLTSQQGTFTYASTIDTGITDLYAKYSHPVLPGGANPSNLPVVVLMHGFTGDADDATSAIMEDMATYGFFTVAVGMRGRNGAGGSPDVSGREIHDIYDAVEYVKANFSGLVDPDAIHITGYSGGGGNVMAAACKFPDTFTVKASHFGISDYGYDATYGWGEMSTSRQSQLATWIGYRARSDWDGTEPVNLNAYRARNAEEGIAGATLGGHLFLYHDLQDGNTQPSLTTRVADAFDAAANTRYTQSLTDTGDDPRWLHDLPHPDGDPAGPSGGAPVRFTRQTWGAAILNEDYPAWQMPDNAQLRVLGYMVTKRFSIWLGDGTEHVAELSYDLVANTFTVTPLTGQVEVTVTRPNGMSATQTFSTQTTLQPAAVAPVDVEWSEAQNVYTEPGYIEKNDGVNGDWDAGARSTLELASGDGSVHFTAPAVNVTPPQSISGLTSQRVGYHYDTIEFGLFLGHGSGDVYVFEDGTNLGVFSTYADGDVFTVAYEGGDVVYKKNGTTFYTSGKSPTYPAFFFASLQRLTTNPSTIRDVKVVGGWS